MSARTEAAVLSAELERDLVWGPMSHPATASIAPDGPPWKDHVYIGFWDAEADAYGFLHWNSSPNHDTGKAQLSASLAGVVVDIKEPLAAASTRFTTPSLDFDLRGRCEIRADGVEGVLEIEPRFSPCDYTANSLLPPLVEGEPLQHWQQGVSLSGELMVEGRPLAVSALGYRTRTWGFRDDSQQFQEYVSVQTCMPSRDITAMKFRWPDGSLRTDGFVVGAGEQRPVRDMRVARNASGLVTRLRLVLDGDEELELIRRGCAHAMWCPIGLPEREGPTFSAHDEVIDFELDGERGHSLVEQAIVRHVY